MTIEKGSLLFLKKTGLLINLTVRILVPIRMSVSWWWMESIIILNNSKSVQGPREMVNSYNQCLLFLRRSVWFLAWLLPTIYIAPVTGGLTPSTSCHRSCLHTVHKHTQRIHVHHAQTYTGNTCALCPGIHGQYIYIMHGYIQTMYAHCAQTNMDNICT